MFGAVHIFIQHLPTFLGPKWHSLRSIPFQGPKKSRFQGPSLPVAFVIDIARIKIIASRAIKRVVTLIVIWKHLIYKLELSFTV